MHTYFNIVEKGLEMSESKTATRTVSITDDMIPDFDIEIGKAQVTKDRVIAAVRCGALVLSTCASMAGFAVDVDGITQVVLCIIMAASMAWSYWQNNNWTKSAVVSQQVLNGLQSANKPMEDK